MLLAMRGMTGCDSVSTFSHIEKIATFQKLKTKSKMTVIIDFGKFPSFSLESLSVVTSMDYACYLCEEKISKFNCE